MKIWPSPIKLNLFLYIIGQRSDNNYHNLQTLFQLIDYGDSLYFEPRSDNKLHLQTSLPGVSEENHLVLVAARALQKYALAHSLVLKQPLGVNIDLHKNTPMGAGLGGGSSNAATTLIALNHMWGLDLNYEQLMCIGRQLGADVSVFIDGHSAFAEGIGDTLTPITLPHKTFLIVIPEVSISTKAIFSHPDLKRDTPERSLENCLTHPFCNDIEPLIRYLYPTIDALLIQLQSIASFRLTGTGSAIFAAFNSWADAQEAQKQLPSELRSIVANGINHSPLHTFLDQL